MQSYQPFIFFHKLSFSYVKEFLISYFFIFSSQANIKPITPE